MKYLLAVLVPLVSLLLVASLEADILFLESGGKIEGKILLEDAEKITIKSSAGTITFARSDIKSIVYMETAREVYEKKRAALARDDIEGHFKLGLWCQKEGLAREAQDEFRLVLGLDGEHKGAREALGYKRYEGKWMTEEEVMEAKGYKLYRGKWVSAEEFARIQETRGREMQRREWVRHIQTLLYELSLVGTDRAHQAEEEFLSITSPEAIPHIEPLLRDSRAPVRAIACLALANLKVTHTAKKIAHLALSDEEGAVRNAAKEALLKMPTTDALRLLSRSLLQAEKRVERFRAARIVGEVGDPRAIPYLIEGLYFREWYYAPSEPYPERTPWVRPYISGSRTTITSGGTVIISPEIGYIRYGPAVSKPREGVPRLRTVRNYQALEALKDMTEQDFHFNKERWRHWWKRHKEEFLKAKESPPAEGGQGPWAPPAPEAEEREVKETEKQNE